METKSFMNNEKMMQLALMLSDISEGIGLMLDALKLTASGLDDVANTFREIAGVEDAEPELKENN